MWFDHSLQINSHLRPRLCSPLTSDDTSTMVYVTISSDHCEERTARNLLLEIVSELDLKQRQESRGIL